MQSDGSTPGETIGESIDNATHNVETFIRSVKAAQKHVEDLGRRVGSLRRLRGRKLRRFVRIMLTVKSGRNAAVIDTFPHLGELFDQFPQRVARKRKYRTAWWFGYQRCSERVRKLPRATLLALIDKARKNRHSLETCSRGLSLLFLTQDLALNESRAEDV